MEQLVSFDQGVAEQPAEPAPEATEPAPHASELASAPHAGEPANQADEQPAAAEPSVRVGQSARRRPVRVDAVVAGAIEEARAAAEETASDFGVGEHLGVLNEGERVVTHLFECKHPGYPGWRWAVTLVRASRARRATVSEVALLPGDGALLAPAWVPWRDRILSGDVAPGTLLPTADNDPRLEPGYTGGELAADEDPAEWVQTRALVAELGLGRERVLSPAGRSETAARWMAGESGPDDQASKLAPANCLSCAYFVRLAGQLGGLFGACTNRFSPFDARVVSYHHGCGGHSDVVADERGIELPEPVFDTITVDGLLFD